MTKDKKHRENSRGIAVISRENRLKSNMNNFNNKIFHLSLDQVIRTINKSKIVLNFQHKR